MKRSRKLLLLLLAGMALLSASSCAITYTPPPDETTKAERCSDQPLGDQLGCNSDPNKVVVLRFNVFVVGGILFIAIAMIYLLRWAFRQLRNLPL